MLTIERVNNYKSAVDNDFDETEKWLDKEKTRDQSRVFSSAPSATDVNDCTL